MFEEFKHPNNDNLYAFLEVPAEFLKTVVPEGAKWGTFVVSPAEYDSKGNEITSATTRQKTLDEFLLHKVYSIDGATALILLAAMERPTMRTNGVNQQDLIEWDYYLQDHGLHYASGLWMTIDQYKIRLRSPDYCKEEPTV